MVLSLPISCKQCEFDSTFKVSFLAEPSLSDVAKFAEGDAEEIDDEVLWAHDTDEIIAKKKERGKNGNGSNYIAPDKLKEEAEQAGFGKLYAALDGGVSGLQACAAGTLPSVI